MNHKSEGIARAGMAASVLTALGASACCIGPIVAATLGLTSLAGLARYEALRPIFGVATLGFLALAFYMTYRRRPAGECAADSLCAARPDPMRRLNRAALWIATAIVLVVLAFPQWSVLLVG